MTTRIEAINAGASYAPGAPLTIRGVNLVIEPGSAIGLVGESGSGKTTLARLLLGGLHPAKGSVTVNGTPWAKVKRSSPLHGKVQYIFQDPYSSLNPYMTGFDAVAESAFVHGQGSKAEARELARELLASTGLAPDAMQSRPGSLSGGQRQRIGIARALAADPDIIIADEPTSALDVSVQAQILNLLLSLQADRGIGLVLVSHDLGVVRLLTDHALVIYNGDVVEQGPIDELLNNPTQDYSKLLVESALI
ncbi:ABC transporter ATP-binding protein [Mycolicibacterium fluoranthenivorans]|uniref:ABC transporter n=1 Tax=Mycolicibacterium fluoranthenivorans TaxID=258505 RepID=A0A1G4WWV8_9MYCO|nr:dipeptide/oligopeptide/nickel ABC transporter ATP-binding protein [Mycolicibacterium fluoranthenivorans]QNJ94780.1 ABC transporter ATP-binding protein [Mycolicibacterium fluoranthenivorans]SCX31327.1 ABC transporter [Mycolicibacterium fluoranthenivorans]